MIEKLEKGGLEARRRGEGEDSCWGKEGTIRKPGELDEEEEAGKIWHALRGDATSSGAAKVCDPLLTALFSACLSRTSGYL